VREKNSKTSGENLAEVLRRRAADLPPPIQMCGAADVEGRLRGTTLDEEDSQLVVKSLFQLPRKAGEEHGNESLATYRHQYSATNTFHLDYCFATLQIANSAKLRIEDNAKWASLSDHYPLILDVDDSLLAVGRTVQP